MSIYFQSTVGIIALILSIIVIAIALLHFYWVGGGKWALDKVIPFELDGNKLFFPTKIMTALVGITFTGIAIFIYLRLTNESFFLPKWIFENGIYCLAGVFLLRAIGDFKYVGFFKKIKGTVFAMYDSKFYSPLSFGISILFFFFEYLI